MEEGRKTRRKRKKTKPSDSTILSDRRMKRQMRDTSDIVTCLDIGPQTKKSLEWLRTGKVEELMKLPGRPLPVKALFSKFERHAKIIKKQVVTRTSIEKICTKLKESTIKEKECDTETQSLKLIKQENMDVDNS